MGLVPIVQRGPRQLLDAFHYVRTQGGASKPEEGSAEPGPCWHPDPGLAVPTTVRNTFLLFIRSVVLCCNSLNRLRHHPPLENGHLV